MATPRPLRRDAARRRSAVLIAAAEVFGEQGIDAPLEVVADRANVGRATLYRNFPDRNALIAAVLDEAFDVLEARASDLADQPGGLFDLIEDMAFIQEQAGALADALRKADLGAGQARRIQARIRRIFRRSIRAARDAGLVRPDLAADDALLITRMLGGALRGAAVAGRRERAVALLFEGLTAGGRAHG